MSRPIDNCGRVSMTVPQFRRHECTVDDARWHLTRGQAELLALLLVSPPDRFLGMGPIIEALWPNPDEQPETATKVARVYLSGLRRLGIAIETRFPCGRDVARDNGWRIPGNQRAPDAELQRLAA